MQRPARPLLTIINDILDFSKIEAGKLALEAIEFALRAVVEEVVELVAERARRKGLDMACVILRTCPRRVAGIRAGSGRSS